MKKILITGSSGLIGSEAVKYFDSLGWKSHGVDNNMRSVFFGREGDTEWNRQILTRECKGFKHYPVDIRDRNLILELMRDIQPDLIVHCAAQPSHDLAAKIPFEDFDVNAAGTLHLLEAARRHAPESVFIHMSTNKVYGDLPNQITLREEKTRWEIADPSFANGIHEHLSIDQSTHSLFGASKVASDIMAQEYGRYFNMKVGVFRGGCLTGASHSGAKLHGFLSYFFKTAASGEKYTIYGYKGKQVRDQIHSQDVIQAFHAFYENPRCGEVYNLGGGKQNSLSILECISRVEDLTGKKIDHEYSDTPRKGDHICYYTDLSKWKSHHPEWKLEWNLDRIFEEYAKKHSL